jgi:hypothetical protein
MFYSLFLIAFGVFLGQEYPALPSVKIIFNNVVEFLDNRKPKGIYRGEFDFTELNNEESNSDSDSDATLTNNNDHVYQEKVKNCNIQ